MWNLPQGGLGSVNSTTYQAEVAYLPINEGSGILYMFVPGNGICAYEIVDTSVDGIEDVYSTEGMSIIGNELKFATEAQTVMVYNIMGAVVASESNVDVVALNLPAGVYIVNAVIEGKTITQKFLIQ